MGCCFCKQIIDERSAAAKDPTSGLGIIDHEETSTTLEGDDDRRRQSKSWNRSLHRMALSVIDISSFETTNYDAKEYDERTKLYASRLDEVKPISNSNKLKSKKSWDPKTIVSKGKISSEDMNLIEEVAEKSLHAVNNFTVHSDQSVVQPFQPF